MKFIKTLLASILGTVLGLGLLFLIIIGIAVSGSEEPEPYVRSNSVLKIEMRGALPDRKPEDPFGEAFNPDKPEVVSLQGLKDVLEKAAVDENIKGIVMEFSGMAGSWATKQEARKALVDFKESGKFLYANTKDIGYDEKGFYLATAADSIFGAPHTQFMFDGFYLQTTFYKGFFDKIGITPEITRSGKYKSAVEPYLRDDLSEANEYQLQAIIDTFSDEYLTHVSEKTGQSVAQLNEYLNGVPSISIERAKEYGLVDALIYPDSLERLVKARVGVEMDDDLEVIGYTRYRKVKSSSVGLPSPKGSDRVAVIYANGPILPVAPDGFPGQQQAVITATKFQKDLNKVRDNDDVKALVVRINSPGGSGATSDLIWRMLRETSKEMPVIASMGSVAASGGYYIAMAADTIVAQPTTITGSIGVFATKFNTNELFTDKLGITFDEVKTHDHADWLDPNNPFTDEEMNGLQSFTDEFYKVFISKVADSRGMSVDEVDERAQGRVWIGSDAEEQKLVDVMGGLDTAIELAAQKAGLTDYKVIDYPKPKDLFQVLMESGNTAIAQMVAAQMPFSEYNEQMQTIRDMFMLRNGQVLAMLPYQIEIK